MVWVTTSRKIGSAGYASVNVRMRSGSTAAPSTSASNISNVEKENAARIAAVQQYNAQIAAQEAVVAANKPKSNTVIVALAKNPRGNYSIENIGGELSESQKQEVSQQIITATSSARAPQREFETVTARTYTPVRTPIQPSTNIISPAITQYIPQPMSMRLSPFEEMAQTSTLSGTWMTSAKTGLPEFVPYAKPTVNIPSNIIRPGEVKEELREPGWQYQKPFLSWEGQKERLKNVGNVFSYAAQAPFSKTKEVEVTLPKGHGFGGGYIPTLPERKYKEKYVYDAAGGFGLLYDFGQRFSANKALQEKQVSEAVNNPIFTTLEVAGAGKVGVPLYKGGSWLATTGVNLVTQYLPRAAFWGETAYQSYVAGHQALASKEAREGMKDINTNVATEQAKIATGQYFQGQSWYKNLAGQIPPLDVVAFPKAQETGLSAARDYLISKGYTGARLENALAASKAQYRSQSYGAGVSLLATSMVDELLGRAAVSSRFALEGGKKVVIGKSGMFSPKLAKIGFEETAPLGFTEGFVQQNIIQKGKSEMPSMKESLLMGGYGATSAGIIGGIIIGLTPIPKGITKTGTLIEASVKQKAPQKIVEWGIGYTGDPYEFIGDISATGYQKIGTRLGLNVATPANLQVRIPVVAEVPSFSFTTTGKKVPVSPLTISRASVSGARVTSVPPISPGIPTTEKPLKTKIGINIPTIEDVSNTIGRPTTPVPDVPVPPDQIIPPKITPIVSSTVSTTTTTDTNTMLSTIIGVPVSVATPLIRFPPPLILPKAAGIPEWAGGGARGRKAPIFVNEYLQGRMLLGAFTGLGVSAPVKKVKISKKQRKLEKQKKKMMSKANKSRREAEDLFNIHLDLPSILDRPNRDLNSGMKYFKMKIL